MDENFQNIEQFFLFHVTSYEKYSSLFLFSPFSLSLSLSNSLFKIQIGRKEDAWRKILNEIFWFVCSVWFSQQTTTVSLHSTNRLGFVAET
jgi:hypothetical protein